MNYFRNITYNQKILMPSKNLCIIKETIHLKKKFTKKNKILIII